MRKRLTLAAVLLLVFVLLVWGVEMLRRQAYAGADNALAPGSIPVYYQGTLIAGFTPEDLQGMAEASFQDAEEGKTQQGWRLGDVLLLFLDPDQFSDSTPVIISSSSRDKQVDLTWGEVKNDDNMVLFDLSGRGTLKLVSLLERLDTRDEWVQDVDRIEVAP